VVIGRSPECARFNLPRPPKGNNRSFFTPWTPRLRHGTKDAGFLNNDGGVIAVVNAGPTFEVVAANKMPDEFSASPVIADGRIYFRGFKALYAIGTAE